MEPISRARAAPLSDKASQLALSVEFSQTLKNWLAVFSEHYRQEISELSAVAYLHGLADLTAAQLDLACAEALRNCRFLPTVADIRSALADARSRMALARQDDPPKAGDALATQLRVCSDCQGLGWRVVPRQDAAGNWAVRCACRNKSQATEAQS